MTRISKKTAEEIAFKLLAKKQKEIDKSLNNLKVYIREFYMRQVPEEIKEIYSKYPEYLNTSNALTINGNGFNYKHIFIDPLVPIKSGYSGRYITNADKKIMELNNKVEQLITEKKELQIDIVNAILNLKTYARVKEAFPEAEPFLPERKCNEIAINYSSIRERIKQ